MKNHKPAWERRDIYGLDGSLYLQKYRIWPRHRSNTPKYNLYLHRFLRPDEDLELHNHPWRWCVSFILSGGYTEERLLPNGQRECRVLKPGMINVIKPHTFHRVAKLSDKEAWTLFATSSKSRSWGFLRADLDFVNWRDFLRMKGMRVDR